MLLAYQIISGLFTCYTVMLFVRIISSWFPEFQNHAILKFIRFYTDPYLNLFRRFIPPLGMFDLSPIVAFFSLRILESIIMGILF